jgi:hypothetical protein
MRAHTPGGRFDSDFESDSISTGITEDLTNPAGTSAEWWKFNSALTQSDPIYDVEPVGFGRVWDGPSIIPIVRATITEGTSYLVDRGFYNSDTLHLTLNIDDLYAVDPELFTDRGILKPTLDLVDKYRVVWKSQVYRPIKTQQAGLVANRHTLIVMDLLQLMPDELVNDAQFLKYAQP